jgi:Domain of unknown function (DUF927)
MSETAISPGEPATEFDGMRAPDALAAALRMAGADVSPAHVATATDYLAKAGTPVSIRKGKERNPAFALHVPTTTDGPLNFSYSAAGSPGHENCCDPAGHHARPRGLYQDDRPIARLPFVWSIAVATNGRTSITAPIMSATQDGPRAVIAWEEIRTGTWADALATGLSPDRRIITAAAAAITELAHDEHTPKHPAAVTPAAWSSTGYIPAPMVECMPSGYWECPETKWDDPRRVQARADQVDVAARRPKIALTWGASIGAVFAGPLKLRQSGIWELTGAARRGKTTALMLAASAWGYPELPPDGMLISWDQTSKGTGRHLGELGIFPAFMDETGTADFGPDEWARLTYSLSLGASRKTAKTRGSMGTNQTPGWQGFLFTTGNGTITDGATAGKFAGVAARVVTLSGEFTSSHEECAALDAAVLADYGWLGPTVIERLPVAEFGRMYRAALGRLLDGLGQTGGGVTGTLAGKAALAVAGAEAIDRVLGTGTRIGAAAELGAREYLASVATPETDRERILRDLAESMSAERSAWADQAGYSAWGTQTDRQRPKLAGLIHDGWVYIYDHTWKDLIKQAGITGSASLALADMHERGELHVPPRRRKQGSWQAQVPRWSESRAMAYVVSVAAISPADQDDVDSVDSPVDSPIDSHRQSPPAGIDSSTPGLTSNVDGIDSIDSRDASHARTREGADHHQDQAPAPDPFGEWPADSIAAAINTTAAATTAAPKPGPEHAKSAAHREGNLPMTAPTATADPRTAYLADLRTRNAFRTQDQWAIFEAACAAVDATPADATREQLEKHANTLKLADAMVSKTGTTRAQPGPFAPRYQGKPPLWHPWKDDSLLTTMENAMVIPGYAYQRAYTGPVTILDRNAAQIAAMASAAVAHGALTRTGPLDEVPRYPAPGYYKVHVYPWTESLTPSPIGPATVNGETWIPAPTMALLRELADADRWPDPGALDSWTGDPCRLDQWARLAAEVRAYALAVYGRGSDPFEVAKKAFSQTKSLMLGTLDPNSAIPRRTWKHYNRRRDWAHAIITLAAANLWRITDQCGRITGPDLAPVALRATDELVIPTAALEAITSVILPGRKTPSVRIDPTTIALGTFKIQGTEDW